MGIFFFFFFLVGGVRLVDLANLALLERHLYREGKGVGCSISRDILRGSGSFNLGFLLESLEV